jgi:inorganic triphosphatase YgiF
VPRELELKYSSLEGRVPDLEQLSAALSALGVQVRPGGTHHQVDVYFDDGALSLERSGLALRVRTAAGARVATVKSRGDAVAGVFEREELEAPLPPTPAGDRDLGPVPLPPAVAQRLEGMVDLGKLGPRLEIATTRELFLLERGGRPLAELSFDEVSCRPPHERGDASLIRSAEFSEVEVEAAPGTSEADLRAIGEALESLTPLVLGSASKLERAASLLAPFQ